MFLNVHLSINIYQEILNTTEIEQYKYYYTHEMESKKLEGGVEVDYDYKLDILSFDNVEKEHVKSIKLDNTIMHIDKESLLIGIQIFEASKSLNVEKKYFLSVPFWQIDASVHDGNKIDIKLLFQITTRNKIIKKDTTLSYIIDETLPDSKLIFGVMK